MSLTTKRRAERRAACMHLADALAQEMDHVISNLGQEPYDPKVNRKAMEDALSSFLDVVLEEVE